MKCRFSHMSRCVQLLVLLLSTVESNSSNDRKKPVWSQIGVRVCGQLSLCAYPPSIMDDLVYHINKHMGIRLLNNDGLHSANLTKANDSSTQICGRRFIFDNGRQTKYAEANKQKPHDIQSNGDHTEGQPLTPSPEKPECSVMSMTRSSTYPHVVYLLLHCTNIKKCYVFLHFVDLRTDTLLDNNTIQFCDIRQNTSQIFTGLCQTSEKEEDCLYVVTLTSKKRITIGIYEEPAPTSNILINTATHYQSFRGTSLVCSFYKSRRLLCLSDGKRPYLVTLASNSFLLTKRSLRWNVRRFFGIKDFKMDKTTENGNSHSTAIIVHNSTVTVVSIDFSKKMIKEKRSVSTEAVTATLTNGYILLHSRVLEKPFYKCKTQTLQSCRSQ